jgi:hypothetical protein
MSQPIPKNQWTTGAGKGDAERPVNRDVLRENLSQIKWHPSPAVAVKKKAGKTTYKY